MLGLAIQDFIKPKVNERLTIKSQDKFKKNKTVKILHNKKTEMSV